jgi:transglutaminase-like putative cysteine protease
VSIFVALHHVTHYKYDRPIDLGPQTVRLRPAPHTRTPILSYSLKVTPSNHFVNWQQDPQGNWLARFVFPEKATELKIEVDFSAQMTVVNPFDFFVEGYASAFPFQYTSDLKTELAPYLATGEQGPLFAAYVKDIPREADSTVNFLVDLNAQLQKKIGYVIRMEPGIQTPEETLASGSGSCRDSAWLLIHIFRHLGLARVSSPAISFSCVPTSIRSRARARSKAISPTCTPGPRSICPAPAGSGSTSPRAC